MYSGTRRSIVQAVVFALGCLRLLFRPFDLIDADHMPYLQLVPLRLVAWIRRRPLVITWHEWWGREYWVEYLGRAGIVASAIERASLRLGDHFVTETDLTASRMASVGVDRARITVIPPGIDQDLIASVIPWTEPTDVLFSGRLLQHKGVDLLLRSLSRLADRGLPLTARIVGEGPEELALQQLAAELDLGGRVTFLRPLEHREDLFAMMKTAGVFVLPSVREGYGMAVAEAIACDVPVVTTDHPDNYAQHLASSYRLGFLCPPSEEGLADAIERALSAGRERRRREDAENGDDATLTKDSLGWPAKAGLLAEVYRGVVAPETAGR